MEKTRYITARVDPRRWARCLNRFDGEHLAQVELSVTAGTIVGVVAGLIAGLVLSAQALPDVNPFLLTLVTVIIGAFLVNRIVVWVLDNLLQGLAEREYTKWLEEYGSTSDQTRASAIHLTPLGWREEQEEAWPEVVDLIDRLRNKIFFGGLIRHYRLQMADGRIYLVDAGYDEEIVYQPGADGIGKTHSIWRLELRHKPELRVYSIARNPGNNEGILTARVENVFTYNSRDVEAKLAGWVTTSYDITLTLEVNRNNLDPLLRNPGVINEIRERVKAIGKYMFSYRSYQEVTSEDFAGDLKKQVEEDPRVQKTGLKLVSLSISRVEGSEQLAAAMQQSFGKWREAQDRKQAALAFAQLDQEVFERMLEMENGAKALDVRISRENIRQRAIDQVVRALFESGMKPLDALALTNDTSARLSGISGAQQPSLSVDVSKNLFEQVEREVAEGKASWPAPDVTARNHEERLAKERNYLQQYAGLYLIGDETEWKRQPAVFEFGFPDKEERKDVLRVEWYNEGTPPRVLWNGANETGHYQELAENIFDYQRVTVFDIFRSARKRHKV